MQRVAWYRQYLEKSDNPWHRKLVAKANFYTKADEDIYRRILEDGNAVIVCHMTHFYVWMKNNRDYQNLAKVHFAREVIDASDSIGLAVKKNSPWLDALNTHLLTLNQAKPHNKDIKIIW